MTEHIPDMCREQRIWSVRLLNSLGEEHVKCSGRRVRVRSTWVKLGRAGSILKAIRTQLSEGAKHFCKMTWKQKDLFSAVLSLP